MSAYVTSVPILYHDGTEKGDALRQALIEQGQQHREESTGQPGSAVVIHDGNCYFCPDSVRSILAPRLRGYQGLN